MREKWTRDATQRPPFLPWIGETVPSGK